MSLEIRDSSTSLRSARNDKAGGGSVYRGAKSAMNARDSLNRYNVTLASRFNDLTVQRFNEAKPFAIH